MQQGIEKANKAFGLYGNFFEPSDSKKLNHSHIELHKKVVNYQLEKVKIFNESREEIKPFLVVFNKVFDSQKYSKILENSRHIKDELKSFDIITISENELVEFIEGLKEIHKEAHIEICKENFSQELKEKSIEFMSILFHSLKNINSGFEII